jgi:hypothetical protein
MASKNVVPYQLNIPTCHESAHFQNTPLKSHKLMNKRILLPWYLLVTTWMFFCLGMPYKNFYNQPCFKSPFICLNHLRKTCGQMIFLFQKSFFLIKCSTMDFNFFVNFNIFHKKGSICSKHSKNIYTYTHLDFDTQTSLSTIIILNL